MREYIVSIIDRFSNKIANVVVEALEKRFKEIESKFDIVEIIGQRLEAIELKFDIIEKKLGVLEEYSAFAVRRVGLNCGDSGLLLKSAVGYVLCPPSDYHMAACLIDTGDLERGTRILVENLVRPGDIVVDVGANIGLFSLAAAKKMNMCGHVYAFEPFPITADYARKNIKLNSLSSFVSVSQYAVSNKIGEGQLYLGTCSGHHSLYPLTAENNEERFVVPKVTLDHVLSDVSCVDLLKIDVEGAELDVLEGAAEIVRRSRDIVMIVEFGASHVERAGCTPEVWMSRFKEYYLDVRVVNDLTGELEIWSLDKILSAESVNLFFSRSNSAIWKRIQS